MQRAAAAPAMEAARGPVWGRPARAAPAGRLCRSPACCRNEAASMSCSVSGPSSTVRAFQHHLGTCALESVTLGFAVTRSLRWWPAHARMQQRALLELCWPACRCPWRARGPARRGPGLQPGHAGGGRRSGRRSGRRPSASGLLTPPGVGVLKGERRLGAHHEHLVPLQRRQAGVRARHCGGGREAPVGGRLLGGAAGRRVRAAAGAPTCDYARQGAEGLGRGGCVGHGAALRRCWQQLRV
jgi:hypothetical protein